ncbi:uncharacterized protein LOC126426569 [Schistocerca serialis cubense]|uniref:uncharacterized protein LOC126426569 n=1 Tax=Schistocerca serialis cubense TaxID=2023355 RepID=UPI00214DF85B|nr:uncharacterized protein LOC126426569 [Schistocerca serialis cubense]
MCDLICHTYTITGLPNDITQHDLPSTIRRFCKSAIVTNVKSLTVTRFQKASLELRMKGMEGELQKDLRNSGYPTAKVQWQKPRGPRPNPDRKTTPSLSVILKKIPVTTPEEEVKNQMVKQGLHVEKAWRIISRKSQQPTEKFRVITHDQQTVDQLLTEGIDIDFKRRMAEPPHDPPPQPAQCGRCLSFEHPTRKCTQQQAKCARCGGQHNLSQCNLKEEKCPNCSGLHSSLSYKCPRRPKEPSNPEVRAPI